GGSGVYTFSVTNTRAETGTISVEVSGVALGSFDAITFTNQAPDADESELAASPTTVIANGVSASTLTITVNDADGEPISGLLEGAYEFGVLCFAAGRCSNVGGSGVYTFSVTNTKAET